MAYAFLSQIIMKYTIIISHIIWMVCHSPIFPKIIKYITIISLQIPILRQLTIEI